LKTDTCDSETDAFVYAVCLLKPDKCYFSTHV